MTDFTSLGLIDFLIVAHYEEKWREAVENGVRTTNLPVVVLTDQQAAMIDENRIEIVGSGPKRVFNGFKEEK